VLLFFSSVSTNNSKYLVGSKVVPLVIEVPFQRVAFFFSDNFSLGFQPVISGVCNFLGLLSSIWI
jgi:hypothetical protein